MAMTKAFKGWAGLGFGSYRVHPWSGLNRPRDCHAMAIFPGIVRGGHGLLRKAGKDQGRFS